MKTRLCLYVSAAPSTVALALVGSLAAAPTAQAATSCDRTGKTVARSGTVRIYRVASRPSLRRLPRYFACMRNRRTPAWPLPVPDTDPQSDAETTLRSLRIAGSFVGYVVQDIYPQELDQVAYSVNAATGRARMYRTTDSFFVVTSLAVSRSGSVAYLDKDTCPSCRYDSYAPGTQPATFHVYRGVGGKRLLLDSGDDIDPASFTIVGSEVHWVRGGQPRSAPF